MKKRNKKPNLKKIKYDPRKVTMAPMFLGNVIMKYELPKNMINDINSSYDEAKELPEWNNHLAGKIEEEKLVNELMTEDMLSVFLSCFATYTQYIQKNQWIPTLSTVWINEMRAGEYNPSHYHTSAKTDVGLSSVLVLKRPSSYGKEICTPNDPCNGHLEFTGGSQDVLGIPQFRVDAQVGEFYVFPYTMLHCVYPFYDTDETRRTLSYNCDLLRPEPETE